MHGLPDIPGLTITGELGSGGFGVVYRARQRQIDRDVAVKGAGEISGRSFTTG